MLRAETFAKTTLKFWKYILEILLKLTEWMFLESFGDNRQDTYGSKVIFFIPWSIYKNWCNISKFKWGWELWRRNSYIKLRANIFLRFLLLCMKASDSSLVILLPRIHFLLCGPCFLSTSRHILKYTPTSFSRISFCSLQSSEYTEFINCKLSKCLYPR